MAIKCSTALVEPPSAMTMTIALRNAFSVMMSRGFKSIFNKSRRYFPASRHSSSFNGSSAGVEELYQIMKQKWINLRRRRRDLIVKGENRKCISLMHCFQAMLEDSTSIQVLHLPVWKWHSQCLNSRCHGVCSVHASASPCSGTRIAYHSLSLLITDWPANIFAINLKGT